MKQFFISRTVVSKFFARTAAWVIVFGCFFAAMPASAQSISGPTAICAGFSSTMMDSIPGGAWSSSNTAVVTIVPATGVVTGVSAGSAVISYDVSGTISTAPISVYPTPGPVSGAAGICAGASTTFSDTSAGGFWFSASPSLATVSSGGVVYGVSGGYATIYYEFYSGCYASKVIAVNPLYEPIAGTNSVCVGSTVYLADTISGGVWHSSNTAIATVSGGYVTGVSAGVATISFTVSGTCGTRTATTQISVNGLPTISLGSNPAICDGITSTSITYTGTLGSPATYSINWSDTAVAAGFANILAAGSIITVAGVDGFGYTGDGGPATSAEMYTPIDLTIDGSSDLFICDFYNDVVRKVNSSGTISTYAGDGSLGFTGNGGPATAATLNQPLRVITDGSGNLYIADIYNNVVRKVSAAGVISTFAGNYVAGYGGDGGPATAASLYYPSGMAIDNSGNLYISDYGNELIRKVNTSGVITTIAGTRAAGYSGDGGQATAADIYAPWSITTDASGNLYFIDYGNIVVRRISTSGVITTVAGNHAPGYSGDGGPATAASFYNPYGLTVDASGNIYIADEYNSVIRKVSTSGVISTIAGRGYPGFSGNEGLANQALLSYPTGVKADASGNVYIADYANGQVRKIVTGPTLSSSHIPLTVPVAPAGTYRAILTVSNSSCTSIGYPVSVTLNPSPDVIAGTSTAICSGMSTTLTVSGAITYAWSPSTELSSVTGTSVTANPGSTINYSVTGTAAGCSNTAVVSVTVNPTPTSISGPSTVCISSNITLGSSGSGAWTSSNPSVASVGLGTGIVTGVSAGTTVITYTAGAGCLVTKVISCNAPPASIAGQGALCTGTSATFTDGSSGGVWSSSNTSAASVGPTTGLVTGVAGPGVANISYTLSGCTSVQTVSVFPSPNTISGSGVLCTGATATYAETITGGAWSSANPSVATVGSGGMVTAVSAGTVTISYTIASSCATAKTISVNITPSVITGPGQLCSGTQTLLTDITTGGAWTSSNTSAAAAGSATGVITGVAGGMASISYTLSGCFSVKTVTVNASPNVINGYSAICTGVSYTFTDVTAGGTWISTNTGVATVNSSGIVSGVTVGTTLISYTVPNGCASTRAVSVNGAPAAVTGSSQACTGYTILLSNTTSGGVWTSSNTSAATVGSLTGIVTGVNAGMANITYTSTGCSSAMTLTVDASPYAVTGSGFMCNGAPASFTDATGGGVWSSTNTSVVTVGLTGIASGVALGTSIISYTVGTGCATFKVVTVNPSPAPISGPAQQCSGQTTQLSDATPGGAWFSTNTSSATVGSTGLVTGVTSPLCTISYTVAGCAATLSVTVNTTPYAISGTGTLCPGTSLSYSDATTGGAWSVSNATLATFSGNTATGVAAGTALISYTVASGCAAIKGFTVNPKPAAIGGIVAGPVCVGVSSSLTDALPGGFWTSSNTPVASVGSLSGVMTGLQFGSATISYTVAGCSNSVNIIVTPSGISGPNSFCSNTTPVYTDGYGGGVWSSTNTGVATIGSASGVITGVSSGLTTISYTISSGCAATKVVSLTASPATVVGPGTMCTLTESVFTNSVPGGTWFSSNTSSLTIGASTGIATGVSIGDTSLETSVAMITYSISTGCLSAKQVTVNPNPYFIPETGKLCTGTSKMLTSVTTGGVWSCTNPAVAVIGSSSGIVTGVTTGTAIISYMVASGCACTNAVTVNLSPSRVVGPDSICISSANDFSDSTAGGTWSSSNLPAARVGSLTGVVNGLMHGVTYIMYTVPDGCVDSEKVYVDTCLGTGRGSGIEPVPDGIAQLALYPNPNNGAFTLQGTVTGNEREMDLVVVDMLGQEVYRQQSMADGEINERIQLPNTLANGMYLLCVRSGGETRMFHFVIAR